MCSATFEHSLSKKAIFSLLTRPPFLSGFFCMFDKSSLSLSPLLFASLALGVLGSGHSPISSDPALGHSSRLLRAIANGGRHDLALKLCCDLGVNGLRPCPLLLPFGSKPSLSLSGFSGGNEVLEEDQEADRQYILRPLGCWKGTLKPPLPPSPSPPAQETPAYVRAEPGEAKSKEMAPCELVKSDAQRGGVEDEKRKG
nr:hypothetical protein EUGRSUZ_J00066 [Ipomoea batatas]